MAIAAIGAAWSAAQAGRPTSRSRRSAATRGSFCRGDRALIFEDPDGTRILATRSEMRLPDDTRILATRSEMRLHQCDAHLECARLALAEGHQAREHVAAARRLVDETGYGRRPEVEDLETQARCKSRLSSSLQVAPDSQWPTCELDRDP